MDVDVRVQRVSLDLGAQLAEAVVTLVAALVVRRRRIVVGVAGEELSESESGSGSELSSAEAHTARIEEVGHVLADVEARAAGVVRERRGAHENGGDVDALALAHGLVERIETDCAILDGLAVDRQLLLFEGEHDARQHLPLPVPAVDARRYGVVSLDAARLEHENEGVADGRLRGGGARARGSGARIG